MRAIPAVVIPIVLLVSLPAPAAATVWNVKPDGTGDVPTIQDAVIAAVDGDVILLGDGTFTGPGNRDVDYSGKEIAIRSASGNRDACVIDCEDVKLSGFDLMSGEGTGAVLADLTITRCGFGAVEARNASPTVSNVVIRDGQLPGIDLEGGAPVLTGCVLESNTQVTSRTSGIAAWSSDVTVDRCEIRRTTTYLLGGALNVHGGTFDIRGCVIEDNSADGIVLEAEWPYQPADAPSGTVDQCIVLRNVTGVAVYQSGPAGIEIRNSRIEQSVNTGVSTVALPGPVTVEGCQVAGNQGIGVSGSATVRDCTVRSNGGAGIRATGAPAIEDCRVQGNGSDGISIPGGTATVVRRCLITGNASGIATAQSLTVEGCTIAGNGTSLLRGGGIRSTKRAGTLDITGCIVWGNCSSDGSQILSDGLSTTTATCSIVEGIGMLGDGAFVLTDVMEVDPLFCSPTACVDVPATGGVWGVQDDSPVLGQACGPIGYTQSTCTAVGLGASLDAASWGSVKAGYR